MQIYHNFPLSDIVYYKIGGFAEVVLKVHTKEDVQEALQYVRANNIARLLPLGIGSNILLNDKPFQGAILWFCKAESNQIMLKSNNEIESFASSLLDDVIRFSFNHNLVGLEWAGGLPSTIGGAIRGNVGAFGSEIKDSIVSAEIIDTTDPLFTVKTYSNADLEFSYRNSIVKKKKNLIVVSAIFNVKAATLHEVEQAKQVYNSRIEYRKKNHEVEYPSCGSVFKNIVEKEKVAIILEKWPDIKEQVETKWHGKIAMGYVIKRLGFSGYSVGGAQISEKHGNYIINKNNASFQDVLTIIKTVQEKFNVEFGFIPEPEVEIVE